MSFREDLVSLAGATTEALVAPVVILGAGPAGLAAAYQLARNGYRSTVIEGDAAIGGIARAIEFKGNVIAVGGHSFSTTSPLVRDVWTEVLGADVVAPRGRPGICYRSKFLPYPPESPGVMWHLGVAASRLFRHPKESSPSGWSEIVARKVMGTTGPARAVEKELLAGFASKRPFYPRRGPGLLWSRIRESAAANGSRVITAAPIDRIYWEPGKLHAVMAGDDVFVGEYFISTIPIRELIDKLQPGAPDGLARTGPDYRYRTLLTVGLVLRRRDIVPFTWSWVAEETLKVARIVNYVQLSDEMIVDRDTTCLGLEYFCEEGDDLWCAGDYELIRLATRELVELGIVQANHVTDGCVIRIPKAIPIADDVISRRISAVRGFLDAVPNLQVADSLGLHRPLNLDEAMLTGLLAAQNVVNTIGAIPERYDLWRHDLVRSNVSTSSTAEVVSPRG